MNWWDELWLNEGFASYMEFVGVSHVKDQWHYVSGIQLRFTVHTYRVYVHLYILLSYAFQNVRIIFLFKGETILIEDLQPVMVEDASMNSHPILQPVNHPDEITEIFDSITYSKVGGFPSHVSRSLCHIIRMKYLERICPIRDGNRLK